ncbi:MAG: TetR/AcrR family transcriptional regulator [Lachnospiraceae bacterium]|nr:TetR/AcrR family transcriptional regulator [Ruminococcus sp.]MCM1276880.1 TetR/AcrR family transcriptional regulator [Lachnospiraceae bacterium]
MKQEEKSLLSKNKILTAASEVFTQKGYDTSTMQDIIDKCGLSKGAIYHHFKSKEEIMQALGDRMFFENNPFEIIEKRTDLNGLQKIKELLKINGSDTVRNQFNLQAIPILKDPHILMTALEANRKHLTPLWLKLLEEGKQDGSISTEYTKEIAELLPLINFWLIPSIFPSTAEEIRHKFNFIVEVLAKMGLDLMDDSEIRENAENFLDNISHSH